MINEQKIIELQNKAYGLGFWYSTFFNDIQKQANNTKYNMDTAYDDFEYICDKALKLKQVEDKAEELEINILTLLQVKSVIYIKDLLGNIVKIDTKDYGLNINLTLKAVILDRNYYFKDYRRTWALTQEELEN